VVNGTRVSTGPDFDDLMTRTLLAMVPADGEIRNLHVSLRRKP
jgi:hypothetical protein